MTCVSGNASRVRRDSVPAERLMAKETLQHVLGSLSERDCHLLILREVEGFSIRELGEILDLNVNTGKIRFRRARARVADIYQRWAGPPARIKERPAIAEDTAADRTVEVCRSRLAGARDL